MLFGQDIGCFCYFIGVQQFLQGIFLNCWNQIFIFCVEFVVMFWFGQGIGGFFVIRVFDVLGGGKRGSCRMVVGCCVGFQGKGGVDNYIFSFIGVGEGVQIVFWRWKSFLIYRRFLEFLGSVMLVVMWVDEKLMGSVGG